MDGDAEMLRDRLAVLKIQLEHSEVLYLMEHIGYIKECGKHVFFVQFSSV